METAYKSSANEMDHSAHFERAVGQMEWGDVLSTLQDMVEDILGDSPDPPPPSPSPPPPTVPAGLGFDTPPEPVDGLSGGCAYGGCIPLGAPDRFEQPLMATPGLVLGQAAPTIYQGPLYDPDIMQSGHLYSQAGAYSQGQYPPCQWPANDVPSAAAAGYPAAPPYPYNDVPVVRLPEGVDQNLPPVGVLNGEVVYGVVADAPSGSAAAPLNTSLSKNKEHENQQAEEKSYVKKPPNAFMLFMKEQRPNVAAELSISDSASVNTVLGQRWKSLTMEEKTKYYEEAEKERQLHTQRHPDWSPRDNYGKKRKRQRNKAPASVKASASKPEEVTQPAKKPCVTPVQSAVMEPPASQTDTSQTTVTLPVCEICHLPQVYGVYWLDSPTTASTALVSPAAPTETQTTNHLVADDGAA